MTNLPIDESYVKLHDMSTDQIVIPDRASIEAAEKRIRPYVRRTPVLEVRGEDFGIGPATLVFKLELLQHAGSFKARGAFTNLLTREIPSAGVVAASGGNHGVAVAYAARTLGIPARIFVAEVTSPAKIAQIRDSGADLEIVGSRYADALAASERWAKTSGALPIHAFDQPETIAGQGTLALELEGQDPEIRTVLVAVGGGGLIAGIAAWHGGAAEPARARVRIVGVEPEGAPTLTRALEAGRPVDAPAGSVAADSLAPARVGELVFPIVRRFVERVILVSDEEILSAQRALWKRLRVVAEPGGAAAFAAVLSGRYRPEPGERVAVVVCGGNTVAVDFDR
jgi:threonine dehydratase